MGCIRVSNCCFGFSSLKMGSRSIAILELILAAISLVVFIALSIAWNNFYLLAYIPGIVPGMVFSWMLLHGVKTRKIAFLIAWLIFRMIGIVLVYLFSAYCAAAAIFIGVEPAEPYYYTYYFITLYSIFAVVAFILNTVTTYFWIVVYSHWKEQKSDFEEDKKYLTKV